MANALSDRERASIDAYWRAANYLSVGQIYLYDNPLLRKPLAKEHIKPRLLGHWGTTPGLNFIYVHLNRVIKKHDLDMIYISGPGHGGPAFVSRPGSPPEVVIGIIHRAGGVASLAHPGRTRIDSRIEALTAAGLDALEVYHSDHDRVAVDHYHRMASGLGLLMTGGSDFHGEPAHGIEPGASTLPLEEWQRLSAARHRHAAG